MLRKIIGIKKVVAEKTATQINLYAKDKRWILN